jgi:hypothetical protein
MELRCVVDILPVVKHVTHNISNINIQFLAYVPYFGRMKVGLCDLHAVCVYESPY